MTTLPAETRAQEIAFTDDDFRALAQLARAQFGLSLAESKKPLVYSRLAKRLRARQITRFSDYMDLIEDGKDNDERLELISALTTNVTSFFREKHHFNTLRKDLVPTLERQSRIRIWSAGCSSGQEPYSIAMTLMDSLSESRQAGLRILATDIDPVIVKRARAGRYPNEEIETLPPALRKGWTSSCPDDPTRSVISEQAKRLITFAELNLMEAWPFKGPFDAIFCRNVAIYFDQETQQTLWARFAEMLRVDGLLFIGHSERVSGPATQTLATAGVTTYRKTAAS